MATTANGVYGAVGIIQLTTGDPATVNDSAAKMPIGAKFYWNGALYRYVKHSTGTGAVAATTGAPAYAKTLTPAATATVAPVFTVTPDASDSVIGAMPVGAYLGAPTNAYFCCIQIGGRANVLVAGAVEGDMLIGHASTDSLFSKISEGSNLTNVCVGKVMEGTSTASLSPAWLMNMEF